MHIRFTYIKRLEAIGSLTNQNVNNWSEDISFHFTTVEREEIECTITKSCANLPAKWRRKKKLVEQHLLLIQPRCDPTAKWDFPSEMILKNYQVKGLEESILQAKKLRYEERFKRQNECIVRRQHRKAETLSNKGSMSTLKGSSWEGKIGKVGVKGFRREHLLPSLSAGQKFISADNS